MGGGTSQKELNNATRIKTSKHENPQANIFNHLHFIMFRIPKANQLI